MTRPRREHPIPPGLSPEGFKSYARLLAVLAQLADQDITPPCRHPLRWHLWTSDQADERAAAAHGCASCPALAACRDHAPHERHGVWFTDQTPSRGARPTLVQLLRQP